VIEAAHERLFNIGDNVSAHSLGNADLNGAHGTVVGHQGERVVVKFGQPLGGKALKQQNSTLTSASIVGDVTSVTHEACVQDFDEESFVNEEQPSLMEEQHDSLSKPDANCSQDNEAAELALQEAIQQSERTALEEYSSDLARAMFDSMLENPDGIILRVTRHDAEIRDSLMTSEVLDECRSRVKEAGCELSPDWGNGALFLIPFQDQSKFEELQLQDVRLENLKPYHIVALRDDEELVKQALNQMPRRRRPQCKRESSGSTCNDNAPQEPSKQTSKGGKLADPASGLLSDIKVEIERTFYTFYTVKEVQASSDSSICRSAPF
jgi:hypothetical protein